MVSSETVVYGIPLENNSGAATLVSRVVTISIIMAIIVIVNAGLSFAGFSGESNAGHGDWTVAINLMLALLIPACGYFGAKNRDARLLFWFSCCNCLSVALSLITGRSSSSLSFPLSVFQGHSSLRPPPDPSLFNLQPVLIWVPTYLRLRDICDSASDGGYPSTPPSSTVTWAQLCAAMPT